MYINNAHLLFHQVAGSAIKSLKFIETVIELIIGNKMSNPAKEIKPKESALHYLEFILPTKKKNS